MNGLARNTRSELKPRSLGVLVAIAGVVACALPSLMLFPGIYGLPIVMIWALVYGSFKGARDRWPWWVAGQWLSLCVVFAIILVTFGAGIGTLWGAPVVAAFVTLVWMVPVALIASQLLGGKSKPRSLNELGGSSVP